jgi:hypothetical protein
MSSFCIRRGQEELERVATETEDDFHYFRDSVHAALEEGGGFGSRFPTFMKRFEGADWKVEELGQLQRELETIAAAFKQMPPEPLDCNWSSKAARSGLAYSSLYDVFVDASGHPLLGRLIHLCQVAQKEGKPILLRR